MSRDLTLQITRVHGSNKQITRHDLDCVVKEIRNNRELLASLSDTITGKLLTVADVADRLGVSTRTVERLINRGQLVPLRFGAGRTRKLRRFTVEQVRALIDSRP